MRELSTLIGSVMLSAVPMLSIGTESKHVDRVAGNALRLRSSRRKTSRLTALRVTGLMSLVFLFGCNDMYDGARIKPLERNTFFANGSSSRPIPEGTVARGNAVSDDLLHTGKINGKLSDIFPFAVTDSIIKRGQDRFTTFCTPCHGRLGDGGGMIVQRGFPRPNSFHADSVRMKHVGHYFDVMTNGFGKMYSYAASVPVSDRWAIVAYIRALQLSQRALVASLPDDDKKKLSEISK